MKRKLVRDMKMKTVKHVLVMFLVNNLFAGAYLFEVKRRLLNGIGYSLGEGTKVVGPVYSPGKLKTGVNCWLGRNLTIHGDGAVEIGDNCNIAPDVTFLTGGHTADAQEEGTEEAPASICVEEGCWVGTGAILCQNITIQKGCMVIPSACVMKNVPEKTLIGGVPARVMKKLDEKGLYD